MLFKKYYISILLLLVTLAIGAQKAPHLSHYSVDDGLSENHVLCMLQDKKGTMWFGTHGGLDRFDGYLFKNYKGEEGSKYPLLNYRLDEIEEDKRGALWIRTTDMNVYRFDPSTESFLQFPQCIEEFKNFKGGLNRITILNDGSIWLNRIEAGFDACFKIEYIDSSSEMSVTQFSHQNGDMLSDQVHLVYSDADQHTWILSTSGITLLKKNHKQVENITDSLLQTDFYSVCELENYLFFGGSHGNLIQHNKETQTELNLKIPIKKELIEIFALNQNEILIATNSSQFYIYNILSKNFTSIQLDTTLCSKVFGCYQDKNNRIWFDADFYGAIYFNGENQNIAYLPVPNKDYSNSVSQNFYVVEDNFRNTWVQVRNGGLYKYNQAQNKLDAIIDDNGLNMSDITLTALADHQGNIWLSTYMQGLYKVVYQQSQFQFLKPNHNPVNNTNNEVRAVFKDSTGNLWVGTKDGLTYLYDSRNELKGLLCVDGTIGYKNPLKTPVYIIMEDHAGTIWLATKGMGLFTLNHKSEKSYNIFNYRNNPEDSFSLSSNAIYHIHEDEQHRLWIASFTGGINIADTIDNKLSFINNNNLLRQYPIKECFKVRHIAEDKKGNFYIGTTNGFLVCSTAGKDYGAFTFERFTLDPNQKYTISGNDVQYILPSKNNNLYLALTGGSLNVIKGGYQAGEVPKFEKVSNLPPDIAYTLLEDSADNIWISTQTRIIKYNQENNVVDLFKPQPGNSYFFSEAATCRTKSGEIMYGTSNGLIIFNPDNIKKSDYRPTIFFDQLLLNNLPISVASHPSILPKKLDNMDEIVLNPQQNNLSISYAAIDYVNPTSVQYAFYLEGLEDDWNYVGDQRIARYNNIPDGTFILHVKSTNSDEVWVDNEKTIKIIRQPSFWESWAIMVYVILTLLISGAVSYIIFLIYRLRNEVAIEHRISEMKLRFFTDISHELRTPLTLIVSPIDNLLRKEALTKSAKDQLLVVHRNTQRLLKLINQILDFRKIQNKKMKLFIEAVEIADYMHDICGGFKKLADEQNIKFIIQDDSKNAQLWIDKDKFEKIFYNLLSNAFKFSRSSSQIRVQISEVNERIKITVHDQGIGISKDKLKLLFNRFESFTSTKAGFASSTGIGLSLIKELVELHQAKIEVESELGKGSVFSVLFRKGYDHFGDNDEFILQDLGKTESTIDANKAYLEAENEVLSEVEDTQELHQPKTHKIIIAEDNVELRSFLVGSLKEKYEVFAAHNGQAAIDLAISKNPDMIISDIMMPGMDGLELTGKLKSDIQTSHIPIILLTAKSNIDSKISAMGFGVDDYITKPFSLAYLEARIENLLKLREQLQTYFKTSLTSGIITLSKPNVTHIDDDFLHKVMQFMEENFENSDIVIDDIAGITGVSRSSFFKKIKGLTGLSPVEFLREFRLQKSTQIIEAGENSVSQLAYRVGMNDARYFSKCFKQKFGITPKDFITQKSTKI